MDEIICRIYFVWIRSFLLPSERYGMRIVKQYNKSVDIHMRPPVRNPNSFTGWSWANEPCARTPTAFTIIVNNHFSPFQVYTQNVFDIRTQPHIVYVCHVHTIMHYSARVPPYKHTCDTVVLHCNVMRATQQCSILYTQRIGIVCQRWFAEQRDVAMWKYTPIVCYT